jgi:hypothetical protein
MQINETNEIANEQPRQSKPPPMQSHGVTNYREMVKHLATTTG